MSAEIDRRVLHPSYKVPVLEWWRGIYQHVFVAYHPFFKLPQIEAAISQDEKRGYLEVFWEDTDPIEATNLIKRTGQAISWAEVHLAVAPDVPKEAFDLAVWLLTVCGDFQERANVRLQKRIEAYCDEHKIFFPQEGELPSIMEVQVGKFLGAMGAKSATAWDELRLESNELLLSTLLCEDSSAVFSGSPTSSLSICGLHLIEPGLLLTSQWEGVEVLIAMTDQALEQARPEDFFEGWYADETTYSDVFNPRDFMEREI